MKTIIIHAIFVKLLVVTFSVVLDWDFQKSAINLITNGKKHINTIYNKNMNGMTVKLDQVITLNGTEKPIFERKLFIDNNFKCNVNFDDIESHYYFSVEGNRFICPKGSHHMKIVKDDCLEDVVPSGFQEDSEKNWELKCYYSSPYIFVIYRSQYNAIYGRKIQQPNWNGNNKFYHRIYDFKLSEKKNTFHPMTFIALDNNDIKLYGSQFTVEDSSFSRNDLKNNNFATKNTYSYAFFNENNYHFYFMTYSSISDFKSGYYIEQDIIDYENVDKISITKNVDNPLTFIDDVIIKKMNFITGTKYIYYEIFNNNKNIIYHGIIDIVKNKVIFNTNETIHTFIPYSKNSMLAITDNSAYKICAIKGDNDECLDECPNNDLVINTFKPNSCGSCDGILFKPDNICINECDNHLYYENNSECGLCKDIEENKKYKLINTTECYEICPEGSEIYNNDYQLCTCKEGFYLEGNNCIPLEPHICHKNCLTCKNDSFNDTVQNCITCKNNFVFENGNCLESCSKGYFEEEKKCNKCDSSCKTCDIIKDNCTSCSNKTFLFENQCLNCNENCSNCFGSADNCTSCENNSDNIFLFNNTCIKECPDHTTPINNICEEKKTKEKENEEEKSDYMLWIFIILITILLLIIALCICKKFCNNKKDNALIEQINTELDDKEMTN